MKTGEKVKFLRIEHGYSEEYLAIQLTKISHKTYSQRTISNLERGKREISQLELEKIAVVLNTTPVLLKGEKINENLTEKNDNIPNKIVIMESTIKKLERIIKAKDRDIQLKDRIIIELINHRKG